MAKNVLDKFTKEELLIEAETLEECGEYLHFSLMGYSADELRIAAEKKGV